MPSTVRTLESCPSIKEKALELDPRSTAGAGADESALSNRAESAAKDMFR